jgi:CubicO group peptidase (beta-lactamase class C family)
MPSTPVAVPFGAASSLNDDGDLIEATRQFIPHVMRKENIPGLNIALGLNGDVIWEEGFGYADLAHQRPMTPATVMRSGSMGKTYTAIAVMQLVEQGIIGLYQPINEVLDFRIINPLGEREITFYDLLTHRSGLYVNTSGHSTFGTPAQLSDHLPHAYAGANQENYDGRSLPVWSAKVGEQFQYSNLGMATLGYLVECANPDGLSFSEYQQHFIIDPLGMTSTQYPPVQDAAHVRPDIFDEISTGYAMFGPVRLPTPDIFIADFPAGGLVTTPGDHIRVLLAYLNGGSYNGYQLLKPETVQIMLRPHVDIASEDSAVSSGLVWRLHNEGRSDYYFGHSGAQMYGWYNDYRAYPNLGVALAIATNVWPMLDARYDAHRLIADFIVSWMQTEAGSTARRPARAWGWKASYVIGLRMAEGLRVLGIVQPIPSAMIETIAAGAQIRHDGENGEPLWDPDGFRAGLADMLAVEPDPRAVAAFLCSDRLRVLPGELELLRMELGGEPSPRGLPVSLRPVPPEVTAADLSASRRLQR